MEVETRRNSHSDTPARDKFPFLDGSERRTKSRAHQTGARTTE
jgi:hypothetical protein